MEGTVFTEFEGRDGVRGDFGAVFGVRVGQGEGGVVARGDEEEAVVGLLMMVVC